MTRHPGYFVRKWRGLDSYQCVQCPVDTLILSVMEDHQQRSHKPLYMPELDMDAEEWATNERDRGLAKGVRIALGFLTWNSKRASVLAANALVDERDRLRALGAEAEVCWVDNGSTDGTTQAVAEILGCTNEGSNRNMGQSWGRNQIIHTAQNWEADYLLFCDGDIEVIPYSAYAFLTTLCSLKSQKVGSIGLEPSNCTPVMDAQVSPFMRKIHPWMLKDDMTTACTQYGLFDMAVFDKCRFDEAGPFANPGWGLEDDDLFIQMMVNGWSQVYTEYFRYLHRNIHSSVARLGAVETMAAFEARRSYVMTKWADAARTSRDVRAKLVHTSALNITNLIKETIQREEDLEADLAAKLTEA